MKRAIGTPSLDALALAHFARGRKAASGSHKGGSRQGGQPVKPRRGIRDERKHALGGTDEQIAAVGPIFDEGRARERARGWVGAEDAAGWGAGAVRWLGSGCEGAGPATGALVAGGGRGGWAELRRACQCQSRSRSSASARWVTCSCSVAT